jgi:hypothetical protein
MGRGELAKRDRGEDRKADHHPDADHGEARKVRAVGHSLAPDRQQHRGEHSGHERPPEADDRGVEILDREAGGGEGEREAENPETAPEGRRSSDRYPRGAGSVIESSHDSG